MAWVQRSRPELPCLSLLLLLALAPFGSLARAEEPLKVPRPTPIRVAHALADAFKADVGDRIFFAAGSASLGARARVALEAQAAWLLQHTNVGVVVEGHSDDPGDEDANLALALARAEIVRDRLAHLGVPESRLRIATFGRTGQVVTCADPDCAAPNRRVVLRIAGPEPAAVTTPEATRPGIRPGLRRLF